MAAKAPTGLARQGKALWAGITGTYELRADELAVLADACRTSDLIATMETGLKGEPLMVRGSMGQQVINPLISELRQYRAARAALLRQLKLPDDAAVTGESNQQRDAANTRWARRGA